jgi:[acyl-carrier-protein] S-malonyltransferase
MSDGAGPVFLFPGSGTQHVGMGADVLAAFPEARAVFARARAVLGYDLAALCAHGPDASLRRTLHAQPAIFVLSVACAEVLRARGTSPSLVAGHSLGEWAALVTANVLRFEDALAVVRLRAELMERAGAEAPGAMAAVMGLPRALVEEVCAATREDGVLDVVIRNALDQFVIAGTVARVEQGVRAAEALGAVGIVLDTANAFHTPLVASVAAGVARAVARIPFRRPAVPFCSNWSGDFLWDPDDLRDSLVAQVTGPIDWVTVSRRLLATGHRPFVELGPRRVLSGLLRRIDRSATCLDSATCARLKQTVSQLSVLEPMLLEA